MKIPEQITATVAPLGPNARHMLDNAAAARAETGLRASRRSAHDEPGPNAKAMLEERRCECGARDCSYCRFDSRGEQHVAKQPSPRPTVTTRELQAVLRETLLVLREQGVSLTDSQIEDRVGNGVMKILGLFEIHYVGE